MNIFKKLLVGTAAVVSSVLVLTGCTSYFSYSYNLDTGDSVEVKLDTSNGLKLKNADNGFKVLSKDGEELVEGSFDTYEKMQGQGEYIAEAEAAGAEGLNDVYSNTDDLLYYSYDENGTTILQQLIKVSDKTCVIYYSEADKDDAEEAFDALTVGLAGEDDD
ncbi:MAG: hypothetical protein U0L49_05315 [Eubacterium sp.]|nr:hypothetical protein [Eubacterium sp.]